MAIKFTPQELALLKQRAQQPSTGELSAPEMQELRERAKVPATVSPSLTGFGVNFPAGTVIGNVQRGVEQSLTGAGTNLLRDFGIHTQPTQIAGYDPGAISTKIGGAIGTVLPYLAAPEAGAAELGAGLLRGVPEAGRLLGQATAFGGTAAALAPTGQKEEAAIGGALGAPAGAALGAGIRGVSQLPALARATLKKMAGLSPKDQVKHIFSILGQPHAENYEDEILAKGPKAIEDYMGTDKNETAAARLIRNQFQKQKDIAEQNYETNVLSPVEGMGLGNSLNASTFNRTAQESMDEGLFDKNPKLKKLGAQVQDFLNQKQDPMFGKTVMAQSVRGAHELQSEMGKLGTAYTATKDLNPEGQELMGLRGDLRGDLATHLNSIPSPGVPGKSLGENYQDASTHYRFNVAPYRNHIPYDILSGKNTNPKNFSKYFMNPNLPVSGEPSQLVIPSQLGNDELHRRIILDGVKNAASYETDKSPKSFVTAYGNLPTKGLKPYYDSLPSMSNLVKTLDNKIKQKPLGAGIIHRHPLAIGAGLLGVGTGLGHFIGAEPLIAGGAALAAGLPLASRFLPEAAKIAKIPESKVSKSLLAAALANITGDNQ